VIKPEVIFKIMFVVDVDFVLPPVLHT